MEFVGNKEYRNVEFTRINDQDKYGTVYLDSNEEVTGLIVKEVHQVDKCTYTTTLTQDIYVLEIVDGGDSNKRAYLIVARWSDEKITRCDAIVKKIDSNINKAVKDILI